MRKNSETTIPSGIDFKLQQAPLIPDASKLVKFQHKHGTGDEIAGGAATQPLSVLRSNQPISGALCCNVGSILELTVLPEVSGIPSLHVGSEHLHVTWFTTGINPCNT